MIIIPNSNLQIFSKNKFFERWNEKIENDLDNINFILPGIKGGVAGSYPFYGKYMRFRYPNWAVKYLCDAIYYSRKVC